MTENLPAERTDAALAQRGDVHDHDDAPLEHRQNLAVAYLPLALIAFLILAFTVAAWTFLATAT
ncbi:MAG: hypothetical protein ACRDGV_10215 [Candidatus Limnocylindria bacterium]